MCLVAAREEPAYYPSHAVVQRPNSSGGPRDQTHRDTDRRGAAANDGDRGLLPLPRPPTRSLSARRDQGLSHRDAALHPAVRERFANLSALTAATTLAYKAGCCATSA